MSTIYVERSKARQMVKKVLMYDQEKLINIAVDAMSDFELTRRLHTEMYYYKIEEKDETKSR